MKKVSGINISNSFMGSNLNGSHSSIDHGLWHAFNWFHTWLTIWYHQKLWMLCWCRLGRSFWKRI